MILARPLFFLILIVLVAAPASGFAETRSAGELPFDVESARWRKASLGERVDRVTQAWLGLPYLLGGLGEGENGRYDRDPLYRFDAFDCTTFVETVLALARSEREADFLPTLLDLRYDGTEIDFVTRNHFPEADWIPNNLRDGFLSEATLPLQGHFPLAEAVATIDKRGWYRKMTAASIQGPGFTADDRVVLLPMLQGEGIRYEPIVNRLIYIPFTTFLNADRSTLNGDLVRALPDLGVVSMVRPGWDLVEAAGTQLNISHQAFLLKQDGEVYLRHATSDSRRRVVEDRLLDYITRNLGSPTLKGLHVLGVRD